MTTAPSPPDPPPRDPRQPADFDPVALGRRLLRSIRVAALGTLDAATGGPMTSLILLVSGLSAHTKNLAADPRCSLLLSRPGKGDPLAHPRLTLIGEARPSDDPVVRRRFLARHPKAKLYADFPDFRFLRVEAARMHLNGGFARAFDGPAGHILRPIADRAGYAELEEGAVAHLNADHPDTLDLYARALAKEGEGPWIASGLDPDGLDLISGDRSARIAFPEPVLEPGALRRTLMKLADSARAMA